MSLATDIDRPKGAKPAQQTTTDVVLGEDWVAPKGLVEDELRVRRELRCGPLLPGEDDQAPSRPDF